MLETSRTTRNLVASIWYDRRWRSARGQDGRSFQSQGLPVRAARERAGFQKHYSEVPRLSERWTWQRSGSSGPEVLAKTPTCGGRGTSPAHPSFTHLDRLVRA